MPQRKRWVLELHIQESHPDVSVESVIGPLSLSASCGSKRRSSRKNRQAQKRICVGQASHLNNDNSVKHLNQGPPINGSPVVGESNIIECISDEGGENSLLSTLNQHPKAEHNEAELEPSVTSLKV